MSSVAIFQHGCLLNICTTNPRCFYSSGPVRQFSCLAKENRDAQVSHLFRSRIGCSKQEDKENYEASKSKDTQVRFGNEAQLNGKDRNNKMEIPFLAMIAIALGIAVAATIASIAQNPIGGSSFGLQILSEGSSSPATAGFTFKAFGYRVMLPEYAPGWIYFWLLMAAGCGLFISEEALNIWVGILIARLLSLDGSWKCFAESFSRNASYIVSTVIWVYWGVCISDLIPFYLGKLFRQSGASDDVSSRLGIGKEKATEITDVVQKYGNLIGFGSEA